MTEAVNKDSLYEVKKDGSMWIVRSKSTGLVQMRSLRRKNCSDWIEQNSPNHKD